jgi:adenosine deaminase CECR1
MAGHQGINMYGWKQLALWSVEHSCLTEDEHRRMVREWERRWQDFIHALITTSGDGSPLATVSELEKLRERVGAARLASLRRTKSSSGGRATPRM